ncbi:hypothetical protein FB567DRAFT_609093 [Paraphoma chrysanthemicola]|uniref:Uncharacterized protein n=1 Tax=Paraphoma chrysanthemicola TaxID=798071 RepID=A0A8K0RCB2_9PLEO|nr:hypothetical protein FB567DRAFT_615164 [Paraphoma chrysanthemicola]KAH7092904.1 hypothetical protein FB567DRAFT_609093 [Paraphoma chrysanthemicola]
MAKNKHNNRKNKKNKASAAVTDLHSPATLPDVNTPDSTSSLTVTPSDLTPVAGFGGLTLDPTESELELGRVASMDPNDNSPEYDGSSTTPDAPAADVHSKLKEKTPPLSRTNMLGRLFGAQELSRRLHQVTGALPPEPYATPPEMPHDLEQRFMMSLKEYGSDSRLKGKNPLDIIREAREAEVKEKKKQAASQPRSTQQLSSSPHGHGPQHAAASSSPDFAQSAQQFSESPYNHDSQKLDANSSAKFAQPTQQIRSPYDHGFQNSSASSSANPTQSTGPASRALFPSPQVERKPSWDFVETRSGNIAPQGFVPGGYVPALHGIPPFPMPFLEDRQQMLPPPEIKIQAPSPTKTSPSKKRRPTVSDQVPPAKPQLTDETTDLPVLAADQENLWKEDFPGNTNALMTIMIPWSMSMTRLNAQLPDAYHFSINAAFPYRVEPPLAHKLFSAAFYDDKPTPHKEIRFLGPGHKVDMTYYEVDVFSYKDKPAFSVHASKVAALRRALKLDVPETHVDHMSMRHRGDIGEGRWAYILIKAHASAYPDEVPPHVMIAWHTTAVTRASKCLHTIYPGGSNAPKSAAAPQPKGLKRSASLQNLAARSRDAARVRQDLRFASSAELPGVDGATDVVQPGALALLREVWKMEKAGRTPLIEGYRVDVGAWREWLEAVGGGRGKVVVWRERK